MDANEPQEHAITLHLSPSEQGILEQLAAQKKMTPEQLLRLALTTYGAVSYYRQRTNAPMPWETHRFDEPFGAGLAE